METKLILGESALDTPNINVLNTSISKMSLNQIFSGNNDQNKHLSQNNVF